MLPFSNRASVLAVRGKQDDLAHRHARVVEGDEADHEQQQDNQVPALRQDEHVPPKEPPLHLRTCSRAVARKGARATEFESTIHNNDNQQQDSQNSNKIQVHLKNFQHSRMQKGPNIAI